MCMHAARRRGARRKTRMWVDWAGTVQQTLSRPDEASLVAPDAAIEDDANT